MLMCSSIIIIKICITVVCCHLLNDSVFAYLVIFGFSYFMHIGHKVYVFSDPPHLVKNVRNNLKKHGFNVDGNLVQWKHIEDFYLADSKLPIRMAPKLTSKHIELRPFASLSVKLATKVVSDSVAAGITTMVNLGALPEDAQHTAGFVGRMDRMFTAVFVEWMDRMFTAVFVEWMDRMFTAVFVEWMDRMFTAVFVEWMDRMFTAVFVGRMDRMFTAVFVGRMDRMFTAVFVERMDRMFTAVFVEWMDRMFTAVFV